ncbi:MAG: hypothetical protein H0X25_21565 [Acidobacteriales bacterium]|nr:hypothetical protein [Terriglobales bacterium]
MATSEREPDGTLWILQDESCGHLLYIPAGETNIYVWDYESGQRFGSQDEAVTWHDANCPQLRAKRA